MNFKKKNKDNNSINEAFLIKCYLFKIFIRWVNIRNKINHFIFVESLNISCIFKGKTGLIIKTF